MEPPSMPSDAALPVDFGRRAGDYALHRPGFPAAFFDHVSTLGIGVTGQQVLDLGTGTGTLARAFAERGCAAVGLDASAAMLSEAAGAATEAGISVRWVCARAEATGLVDATFDIVCAGQCWHWFDRPRAAAEVARLLRAGGRVLIAHFSYLPDPGTIAAATEQLVLRYNPGWAWAGHDGRHADFVGDLVMAGLRHVTTFDFITPVAFTREGWRGRFRACNGVLSLAPAAAAAFDADLAHLLAEQFPEPFVSEHRIFGIVAEKPT